MNSYYSNERLQHNSIHYNCTKKYEIFVGTYYCEKIK